MSSDAPIDIVPATVSDAEAIIRVHFAAVHETAAAQYGPEILATWSKPISPTRIERMGRALAGGKQVIIVAKRDGDVVGFGQLASQEDHVIAVYVHPSAGRRGVGARLLRRLESLAIEHGSRELHLDASLNAEVFYLRHGYTILERGVHELSSGVTMPCVKKQKALDDRTQDDDASRR